MFTSAKITWFFGITHVIPYLKNIHQYGPQTKFSDFSMTLIANYKIPWLATKPWLFPDSEKDWNFPDFSLTVATFLKHSSWYLRQRLFSILSRPRALSKLDIFSSCTWNYCETLYSLQNHSNRNGYAISFSGKKNASNDGQFPSTGQLLSGQLQAKSYLHVSIHSYDNCTWVCVDILHRCI